MAVGRGGSAVQTKLGFLIYGEQGCWKSSLALELMKFTREDGKPFRVLFIDPEQGSVDTYLEKYQEAGYDLKNIYIIYTQSISEVKEFIRRAKNNVLNVGPDATGKIQKECVEVLKEIGDWLNIFGESIFGCDESKLRRPEWGRYTKKDNYIYAHIFERPLGPCLVLPYIDKEDIESIVMLKDGSEIKLMTQWIAANYPKNTFAEISPSKYQDITVLKIKLKD